MTHRTIALAAVLLWAGTTGAQEAALDFPPPGAQAPGTTSRWR